MAWSCYRPRIAYTTHLGVREFHAKGGRLHKHSAARFLLAAECEHADEARWTPSAVRACVAYDVLLAIPVLGARQRNRALGWDRLVARDAGRDQRLVFLGLVTRHRGQATFLKMSFAFEHTRCARPGTRGARFRRAGCAAAPDSDSRLNFESDAALRGWNQRAENPIPIARDPRPTDPSPRRSSAPRALRLPRYFAGNNPTASGG